MNQPTTPFDGILAACGFTETPLKFGIERHQPSLIDIHLRDYPLMVTNPKAISRIILPSDSHPMIEITRSIPQGVSMQHVIRVIGLLRSRDRRQRKRGSRLAARILAMPA